MGDSLGLGSVQTLRGLLPILLVCYLTLCKTPIAAQGVPDSQRLYLKATFNVSHVDIILLYGLIMDTTPLSQAVSAGFNTTTVLIHQIDIPGDNMFAVVGSLDLPTNVTDEFRQTAALRVLEAERVGGITVRSVFFPFIGYVGIFNTGVEVDGDTDAIDWCSSPALFSCRTHSRCEDSGLRYTCPCQTGFLDNGTVCNAVVRFNVSFSGNFSDIDVDNDTAPQTVAVKNEIQDLVRSSLNSTLTVQDVRVVELRHGSLIAETEATIDTGDDELSVTAVTSGLNNLSSRNVTVGGRETITTVTLQGSSVSQLTPCQLFEKLGRTCSGGKLCVENGSSAKCECPAGHAEASSTNQTCVDIDECSTNQDECDDICLNTVGNYTCDCASGFQLNADGRRCDDINECETNNGGCAMICVNTNGSYSCACDTGFALDSSDLHRCTDINECSTNGGGCAHVCLNTNGSYVCECNAGYILEADGHKCLDIDECSNNNGGCDDLCDNIAGSYSCNCSSGYTLTADERHCIDIDECSETPSPCPDNCYNVQGSYHCGCQRGYRMGDNNTCEDIDECSESTHACGHTCVNTVGSYRCECNAGFNLTADGRGCIANDGCGGAFTSDSGALTSPGYPNVYWSWAICTWTVSVKEYNSITLSFFVNTPQSLCRRNYVEVRDGNITGERLASFCGIGSGDPVISSENAVLVRLVPYSYYPTFGSFNASWTSACRRTLTAAEGVIQSPLYPDSYPTDVECTYVIEQPRGYLTVLNFSGFSLDSGCQDTVEIYDGPSEFSPVLGRYCGATSPGVIMSSGNALWIRFRAGNSSSAGFQATYQRQLIAACMNISLTASEGKISSPGFPELYPEDGTCVWTITADSDHIVEISFDVVSMDGWMPRCNYYWNSHYVSVFDGPSVDEAKLLARLCGSRLTLPPLRSTGNELTVVYTSRINSYWNSGWWWRYNSVHGFQAFYTTQPNGSRAADQNPLYPYGLNNGDTQLYTESPRYYYYYWWWRYRKTVFLPTGVPDGDQLRQYAIIEQNGWLRFAASESLYWPGGSICVYCSSALNMDGTGGVFYQLYDKNSSNTEVLEKATNEVRQFSDAESFNASLVLVVTWDRVVPRYWWYYYYRWTYYRSGIYYYNPYNGSATFQIAVVSNGTSSYALVYYKDGAMGWTYSPGYWRPYVSMYRNWQEKGLYKSSQLIYSGTEDALKMDTIVGNTGRKGMWIYQLGKVTSNPDQECEDWYQRNLPLKNQTAEAFANLPQCPCGDRRIRARGWTWSWSDYSRRVFCYRLSSARSRQYYPHGQECCYSYGWWSSTSGYSFIADQPDMGYATAYNPNLPSLYKDYWREDRQAHELCCYRASSTQFCDKFYELRPASTCRPDLPFRFSWLWGDPQILTLDELQYTFNGWGEYTLVNLTTSHVTFTLQGRTDLAETDTGRRTNATVFVAFGVEEDGVRVFVGLDSANRSSLQISANGTMYGKRFQAEEDFFVDTESFSLARDNDSLVISFSSGIGLTVSASLKSLAFAINVPLKYRNQTQGLLGNFNGIKDDEFILPNGTVLSSGLSEKDIFHHFGPHWAVTDTNSVMRYESREGPANYSHPEFVPLFLEDQPEAKRQEAEQLCGATNIPCIYDYVATGSTAFASSSLQYSTDAMETNELTKNTMPVLDVPKTLHVTSGVATTFTLSASDPDVNDTVTYHAASSSTGAVQVNSGTGEVTFLPGSDSVSSLSFYAVDRLGVQSVVRTVPVVFCSGCSGHGVCDFSRTERLSKSSSNFQRAVCECEVAWAGTDCDEDRDGCAENPCQTGQTCVDLTPEEQGNSTIGYDCGACPTGFERLPYIEQCWDTDECENETLNECEMNCTNTQGSYECSCHSGYRLASNGLSCYDINECAEGSDNCAHICINGEGSFTCACEDGYQTDDSGVTCVHNSTTATLCADSGCSQGCKPVAGSSTETECFCFSGYDLDVYDNQTCVDHDECADGVCSQRCINLEGDVACACYSGYELSNDQRTCVPCPDLRYGPECQLTCSCNGRGLACHSVTGCVCEAGWTGTQCETDVEECAEDPAICAQGMVCSNSEGSYTCSCAEGYEMDANGFCQDINECAEDPLLNPCGQLENCVNVPGSYYCACYAGYKRNADNNCVDIDECLSGINDCEQVCVNVEGSFNCECYFGFTLNADYTTCTYERNVCGESAGPFCDHGCTLRDEDDQPVCFCRLGYRLGFDQQTCVDIDECEAGTSGCTDTCTNTDGGFVCACPSGKKLDNDGLTCLDCPAGTYGQDCVLNCECGLGASTCDAITGCVCMTGWRGPRCEEDVNECELEHMQQECREKNAKCVNYPGGYGCRCEQGYKENNEVCQDVDECLTNVCDQECQNSPGSYRCLCSTGFSLDSATGLCTDFDECAMTITNNCTQECQNTVGGYLCTCNQPGYVLNSDGISCSPTTSCDGTSVCPTENGGGCSADECFCNAGYSLTTDGSCEYIDVDWCEASRMVCEQDCHRTADGKSITCSCRSGYLLNDDGRTCRACPAGTYGTQCTETCTCNTANTARCDHVTGACECKAGWQGYTCSDDVNECAATSDSGCTDNSICVNTVGSYVCTCNAGSYKTSSGTCSSCPENYYGENCADRCDCSEHSTACDAVAGSCICQTGWKGTRCEDDVNECSTGQHTCTGDHELCVNAEGSFSCVCKTGYWRLESDQCALLKRLAVQFTVHGLSVTSEDLADPASASYLYWERAATAALSRELSSRRQAFFGLENISLRHGSLIIEVDVILNDITYPDATQQLAVTFLTLIGSHFTIGGETGSLAISFEGRTVNVSWTVCEVFEAMSPCQKGFGCQMSDGVPECRPLEQDGSDSDTTVAVAVGVVISLVITIAVVVAVCIYKHKQTQRTKTGIYTGDIGSMGSSTSLGSDFKPPLGTECRARSVAASPGAVSLNSWTLDF